MLLHTFSILVYKVPAGGEGGGGRFPKDIPPYKRLTTRDGSGFEDLVVKISTSYQAHRRPAETTVYCYCTEGVGVGAYCGAT